MQQIVEQKKRVDDGNSLPIAESCVCPRLSSAFNQVPAELSVKSGGVVEDTRTMHRALGIVGTISRTGDLLRVSRCRAFIDFSTSTWTLIIMEIAGRNTRAAIRQCGEAQRHHVHRTRRGPMLISMAGLYHILLAPTVDRKALQAFRNNHVWMYVPKSFHG